MLKHNRLDMKKYYKSHRWKRPSNMAGTTYKLKHLRFQGTTNSRNHELKELFTQRTINSRNYELNKLWTLGTMNSRDYELKELWTQRTMNSRNYELKERSDNIKELWDQGTAAKSRKCQLEELRTKRTVNWKKSRNYKLQKNHPTNSGELQTQIITNSKNYKLKELWTLGNTNSSKELRTQGNKNSSKELRT